MAATGHRLTNLYGSKGPKGRKREREKKRYDFGAGWWRRSEARRGRIRGDNIDFCDYTTAQRVCLHARIHRTYKYTYMYISKVLFIL